MSSSGKSGDAIRSDGSYRIMPRHIDTGGDFTTEFGSVIGGRLPWIIMCCASRKSPGWQPISDEELRDFLVSHGHHRDLREWFDDFVAANLMEWRADGKFGILPSLPERAYQAAPECEVEPAD
jgi:hypothetical protein